MIEVDFGQIKRRLQADNCVDLLRGRECLKWQLWAGETYSEAVRPWKKNVPELFTKRNRPTGHRARERHLPRNEGCNHVRQR